MTPLEILAAIPKLSVLVVGDVCLDRWCTYDPAVSEPSRETGIPRLGVVATEITAGAAGTVANNLAALGCARVSVLGVIGNDGFGVELSRALDSRGIESRFCVRASAMQTFTYTKLINSQTGVEDQPRVDFVNTVPLDAIVERAIIANLYHALPAFDVVIVSDQSETGQGGVVTPAVRDALCEMARSDPQKIFIADSRARITEFRHVIAKPNQHEAEAACRALFGRVDYAALRAHLATDLLMITHGGDGVLLVHPDREEWVRTQPVANPVDICGAGDSFSAGCALALATGASPAEAASFGNLAASITIMQKGTGVARREEVAERCASWQ